MVNKLVKIGIIVGFIMGSLRTVLGLIMKQYSIRIPYFIDFFIFFCMLVCLIIKRKALISFENLVQYASAIIISHIIIFEVFKYIRNSNKSGLTDDNFYRIVMNITLIIISLIACALYWVAYKIFKRNHSQEDNNPDIL